MRPGPGSRAQVQGEADSARRALSPRRGQASGHGRPAALQAECLRTLWASQSPRKAEQAVAAGRGRMARRACGLCWDQKRSGCYSLEKSRWRKAFSGCPELLATRLPVGLGGRPDFKGSGLAKNTIIREVLRHLESTERRKNKSLPKPSRHPAYNRLKSLQQLGRLFRNRKGCIRFRFWRWRKAFLGYGDTHWNRMNNRVWP